VRASFLEIYQDEVYDLLNAATRQKMEVKESKDKGFDFVHDFIISACHSDMFFGAPVSSECFVMTFPFSDFFNRFFCLEFLPLLVFPQPDDYLFLSLVAACRCVCEGSEHLRRQECQRHQQSDAQGTKDAFGGRHADEPGLVTITLDLYDYDR
jgi:hypothetical protein